MVILTSCGQFSITEGQEKEAFFDILDEAAGYDAAAEFRRWANKQEYNTKEQIRDITAAMEEHELAADGYYQALVSTEEEEKELLKYVENGSRINRQAIIKRLSLMLYELTNNY